MLSNMGFPPQSITHTSSFNSAPSDLVFWGNRSLNGSTFRSDFHSIAFSNMLRDTSENNQEMETIERKPVVGKIQMPCPPQTKQKLCEVCGNIGATSHYGGTVCGGCKIFFSRTVQSRKGFVCERDGQCPMNAGKRAKCRACRFQLCLRAHMSPDEVGRLRDLRMGEYQPMIKKEGSVVGYFDESSQPSTSLADCTNQIISFIDAYNYGNGGMGILSMLVNSEKSCENNGALKYSEMYPKNYNASFDMITAMSVPMQVCDRIPMDYMREAFLKNPKSTLKLFWCRNVVHFLEWVNGNRDLDQFSIQEKAFLIAENFSPVAYLTACFGFLKMQREKFEKSPEDVPPPCSSEWFSEISQMSQEANIYIQKTISEIIEPIDSLDVSIEEMILMKYILLYNEPTSGSFSDGFRLRCYRLKYCELLRKYIKKQISDTEKRIERISELLKIIESVRNTSHMLDNWITMFYTSNTCEMNDVLVYDFHVRMWNDVTSSGTTSSGSSIPTSSANFHIKTEI